LIFKDFMKPSYFSIQSLTELLPKKRWLWHALFWVAYAGFQFRNYYITIEYYDPKYLEFMLITRIPFVAAVYLTLGIYKKLIPRKSYIFYTVCGASIWILFLWAVTAFQKYYLRDLSDIANTSGTDLFLNQITTYLIFFIMLTMCKQFKDNYISQYNERENKNLQLSSELSNLKAQIAPHFLFNTMNNFYGLAVEQSPKLPALMVGLSELLRYSLYETNNTTVPLTSEVRYLRNYAELEKIRLEDTLDFEFTANIDDHCTVQIIPLLLVVFVENAFKHAKNVNEKTIRIKIQIRMQEDGIFYFEVKNNCTIEIKNSASEKGIGLENARKRLAAFYPSNGHSLSASQTNDEYTVVLKINFAQTA
jgi:two-component system, LytTR family, sensor histidine kinase LytS